MSGRANLQAPDISFPYGFRQAAIARPNLPDSSVRLGNEKWWDGISEQHAVGDYHTGASAELDVRIRRAAPVLDRPQAQLGITRARPFPS